MAKKKRASLQDIIHKRQQREFVGRSEQLDRFRANLHRSWDDDQRLFLFNVYGQGGVGKSTLLERFRQIANDAGAISALVDEQEMDVPAVMASFAEQFKKQGYELKQFEARYRIYRQKREELEADPEAPPGLAGFAARVLTRATAHVVRHTVPGSGVVLGLVNEDELAAQAEAWVEFVRRRLANNKDEVQLLLKPNEILTPVFLNELNEINDEVTLVLIFDTYERTSDYLDAWLRNVLNGRYGEVPLNILVIIGGRDALDRDLWIPFTGIMASLSLEPFTEDEARDYLERKGVHDEQVIDIILSLSDRLPLLVAMLAAESPDDPTQIGDASGTAIDRFLKWVDDPLRRRIALDAALPHYLNYDVFAVLVPQETEFHFNWLKKTPFVKEKSEGWVYHEIVRTQMLRYKQRNSPQEWEELHEKLAEYFRDKRDAMQLTRDEGIIRDTWRRSESEFIYHTACIAPYVGFDALLSHLIAILGAGRATQAFYLYCSELILQAAKETSSEGLELWGNRLVKGIVAYNSRNYPASIELFTELVSYFRKDSNSKACALRWRGQVYRLVKNYKSALDDLEEAASLLPLDIRILIIGFVVYDLGITNMRQVIGTHVIELSEAKL
ncbi:MAG: ATP-binding protein [Ardenticatenaceae bacterium]|nr:ATP-binding protein [Ardenticatenaceae bacterium]